MAERPTIPVYRREFHPNDAEVNFNQIVSMIDAVAGGLPTYPAITLDIDSIEVVTAAAEFTLTVEVKVIEGQTITYQWEKAALDGNTFSNVSGATSGTLTIASWADATDKGKYRCKIVNTKGDWTATVYSNVCVATTAAVEGGS
jgi:hypothetical protein